MKQNWIIWYIHYLYPHAMKTKQSDCIFLGIYHIPHKIVRSLWHFSPLNLTHHVNFIIKSHICLQFTPQIWFYCKIVTEGLLNQRQVSSEDRCCWVGCESWVREALSSTNDLMKLHLSSYWCNVEAFEVVSALAYVFLFQFMTECLKDLNHWSDFLTGIHFVYTISGALTLVRLRASRHGHELFPMANIVPRLIVPPYRGLQNFVSDAWVSCYQIELINLTQSTEFQ